jgi:hypothetical protein
VVEEKKFFIFAGGRITDHQRDSLRHHRLMFHNIYIFDAGSFQGAGMNQEGYFFIQARRTDFPDNLGEKAVGFFIGEDDIGSGNMIPVKLLEIIHAHGIDASYE